MKKEIVFTDVRCPQCNEVVLSHLKTDYLYGSPVRECPFCKAEVIDPFYHEIVVDGYRKDSRDTKKLIRDLAVAIILTAVLAFFNLLSFALDSGSVIMVMLTIFAFGMIFIRLGSYFNEKKRAREGLKGQADASEARMQDKAYAAKLSQLGYKVPQQYL